MTKWVGHGRHATERIVGIGGYWARTGVVVCSRRYCLHIAGRVIRVICTTSGGTRDAGQMAMRIILIRCDCVSSRTVIANAIYMPERPWCGVACLVVVVFPSLPVCVVRVRGWVFG